MTIDALEIFLQENVRDADLADLIRHVAEAASAFMRGEMRRYLSLIPHADDYTLLAPYGGEPRHGFDLSDDYIESMERYFHSGEAEVEMVAAHRSGDLAVLVMFERQHGIVGGLPDQDWSLRVTMVFRRDAGERKLVVRHADPLVHSHSLEQIAVIARG